MIYKDENICVVSNSIKGVNRSFNQDDVVLINASRYYFFALFDGVSSIIESIDFIKYCKIFLLKYHTDYFQNNKLDLKKLIFDAHKYACQFIAKGRTTCSSIVIYRNGDVADFVNIGDSRIYAFSNTYLNQVTKDDTVEGNKYLITKSLGNPNLIYNDIEQQHLKNEDCFILCSDGFHSLMECNLKEYFQVFHYRYPKNTVNRLYKIQKNLNSDDSTYILIKKR